jgi:hypothetical protein
VVAAMPRAAVAVEETMVEAQLVVTKPLKFKVSVPFMHFFFATSNGSNLATKV